MDLNAVLGHAVRAGARDVHLKVGQPRVFRTDGELTLASDFGPLGDAELEAVLDRVTAAVPRRRQLFDESGDLDLAYSELGLPPSRERLPAARRHLVRYGVIPYAIPSFDDLHRRPGVASRCNRRKGSRLRPL